jgi:hypothetical protein
MSINEIMIKIENLSDMIMYIDNNVKYNINNFWTILAVGLTFIGLISFGWIRIFVANEVEKRLKEEVANRLKNYVSKSDIIRPTLLMGWYGSEVEYWKDDNGYINLVGTIHGGIMEKTVMVFPKNYRPFTQLQFPVTALGGNGRCIITTDGVLYITECTNTLINLAGIRFKSNCEI